MKKASKNELNPKTQEPVGDGSHTHGSGCKELIFKHRKLYKKAHRQAMKIQAAINKRNRMIWLEKPLHERIYLTIKKYLIKIKLNIKTFWNRKIKRGINKQRKA